MNVVQFPKRGRRQHVRASDCCFRRGIEDIELPFPVGLDAIAFEVMGSSMLPKYDPGMLVVCSNGPRNPDDFLNLDVAVRTSKGARYLKKLRPGSKRGLYTLESFNADPIRDVKIAWLGEVLAIVPAHRRAALASPKKRAAG
jgi:phage repressor protein C with HTH and peptisase S24 domain